jgi:hypothetical protein
MKTNQVCNVLAGIVLGAVAGYFYVKGRIPGRGGVTSMTRESHPAIFWTAILLIAITGALLVFYGVSKTFNFASDFTNRVDRFASRFAVLLGRRDQDS